MKPLKIAFIIRRLNVKGGTQRQALSLVRELRKRGHIVKAYTFLYSPENCYPDLLEGLEVVSLERGTSAKFFKAIPLIRHLEQVFNENRLAKKLALKMDKDFDVLNPHDQVSYKVAYYYKKRVKKAPSVWHMNDLPLLRWGYDKMRGVDDDFQQSVIKRIFYYLFDLYEIKKFLRHQDKIIVVDNFNVGLVKDYMGLEAETVRSGPDIEHFTYTARKHPGKDIKILTSGILMPHRRYQDTISAVGILAGWGYNPMLTILGAYQDSDPYYKKLTRLVGELGLENRVSFVGRVTEKELLRVYAENDVYIFQHHLQSDGLSPFEAAVSGLPVVISRTAGSHETLTDHENALLINPKDPEDIAGRIKELADNPELYLKLSKSGAEFVKNNFSWEKYADGVLKEFQSALSDYSSG